MADHDTSEAAGVRRRRRRPSRLIFAAGFLLSLFFAVLALLAGDRPSGVNADIFDRYQRIQPREYDPALPVRIVDIDGESLARYGQWPWPRPFFAELVRRLAGLGAAVIVFDVVFAEADRTAPERLEQTLKRFDRDRPEAPDLMPHSSHDVILARTIAEAPVVLGMLPKGAPGEAPPSKAGVSVAGADPSEALVRYGSADLPLDVLVKQASGLGVAGLGDGRSVTVRRTPIFLDVGGKIMPSLAAEALRVAQGARSYVLKSSEGRIEGEDAVAVSARIGAIETPLSGDGTLWIRYAGPQAERRVPAWRVLDGVEADPALAPLVAGQIVLVGTTAPGLRYLVGTPMSEVTDGISVHAEIIEQMLLGTYLYRPDWAPPAEALVTFLLCITLAVVLSRHRPMLGTALVLIGVAAVFAVSWYAFTRADMLLGPAWPALGLGMSFASLTLANYFRSDRERHAVRGQFERFVSADVIAEIMADPQHHLSPGGEERELTILFMDVRNFSTLSEDMDPSVLIRFMNDFLGPLSEEILATGGTIDKYIGDAIMAFWNAPLSQPDHPGRALQAALAMRRAIGECNARFAAEGLPEIEIGVGLNTGPCSVGAMGSARRLDYSCIGDAVNLASRLEGLTKTYGVWNCVGNSTARLAGGFTAIEIDRVTVKGRHTPEPLWTVLGDAAVGEREAVRRLTTAIADARSAIASGDTAAARRMTDALPGLAVPEMDPTRLAQIYRAQLEARSTAA